MSRTVRNGDVLYTSTDFGLIRYNRYWMKHDPAWYRRGLNQSFKAAEKQYFRYFGETLRPIKNRGYYW